MREGGVVGFGAGRATLILIGISSQKPVSKRWSWGGTGRSNIYVFFSPFTEQSPIEQSFHECPQFARADPLLRDRREIACCSSYTSAIQAFCLGCCPRSQHVSLALWAQNQVTVRLPKLHRRPTQRARERLGGQFFPLIIHASPAACCYRMPQQGRYLNIRKAVGTGIAVSNAPICLGQLELLSHY